MGPRPAPSLTPTKRLPATLHAGEVQDLLRQAKDDMAKQDAQAPAQ